MKLIRRVWPQSKGVIILLGILILIASLLAGGELLSYIKGGNKPQQLSEQGLTLLTGQNPAPVPIRGPVPISFSTPVSPAILKKNITLPAPGVLKPATNSTLKGQRGFQHFNYFPLKALNNGAQYHLAFNPKLENVYGEKIKGTLEMNFTTVPLAVILKNLPGQGEKNVKLFTPLWVEANQNLRAANITVLGESGENVSGSTEIKGQRATFKPDAAFLPDSQYSFQLEGLTEAGEPFSAGPNQFTTIAMGNKTWVEVNLKYTHSVSVYRGKKCIRKMLASGGKPSSPTPLGEFYTQDRGYSFYSPKFGEGALYYVRLVGQILIHSVPKDRGWETKMDEHEKLGLPASHGCVRLDEADARWFYINVPANTLVIIHK